VNAGKPGLNGGNPGGMAIGSLRDIYHGIIALSLRPGTDRDEFGRDLAFGVPTGDSSSLMARGDSPPTRLRVIPPVSSGIFPLGALARLAHTVGGGPDRP